MEQRLLEYYLHPGAVYVSEESCVITTILATCVAVCLWDPKLGIGGANHFLMPYWQGMGDGEGSPRFGATACTLLLDALVRAGVSPRRLRAKVFGGRRGLNAHNGDLGARNAELALRILGERRIPVDANDTGGDRSRKLRFQTHDGVALVAYL